MTFGFSMFSSCIGMTQALTAVRTSFRPVHASSQPPRFLSYRPICSTRHTVPLASEAAEPEVGEGEAIATRDRMIKELTDQNAQLRLALEAPDGEIAGSALASADPWTADRVRSVFIDYFVEKHAHTFYPSAPVVPYADPTLLFINSGMAQFKPIFQGTVEPGSPLAPLVRAANTQKCIRAGGKHNDLEDVGMDTYHHTLFEMLGSWSFGDYFKQEAVDWAWELLTEVYALPKDRFYATYFGGDEALGLEPDLEAREMWLRYLPEDRVLPGSAKDNFWEMGDTGPCGPCSEIHYDRIGGRNAADLVNMDDPDVLEVWNLVFMQFNREPSGDLRELPAKHVDTGMGFERLVSVLQDKRSNYDTDVFMPIFAAIQAQTKARAYAGKLGDEDDGLVDTAYRVIADHIRTLSFSIADGALPSNEGRGYVLRRILRRAVRYGRQKLGAGEGFFAALVPTVSAEFGATFPELRERQAHVQAVIAEEEQAFSSMLQRGIKEFNTRAAVIKKEGGVQMDGSSAFFLYDTMGFPLDLTQLMAREAGLDVDETGFADAMKAQKARSAAAAAAAKGVAASLKLGVEQTAWLAAQDVPFTDDAPKFEWEADATPTSKLKAIFGSSGFVDELQAEPAAEGEETVVGLVLDRTSYYAEAGGQACDVGSLLIGEGDAAAEFEVSDVQAYGGFILHVGVLRKGSLQAGQPVRCAVDYERRKKVAPNHTITHMLNAALLRVLGDGVDQKGSDVDDARLRFDFSHGQALKPKQLAQVEGLVRESVQAGLSVHSSVVPLSDAMAIGGLRAVFGESYPDPVRVVSVGSPVEALLGSSAAPAADNHFDRAVRRHAHH